MFRVYLLLCVCCAPVHAARVQLHDNDLAPSVAGFDKERICGTDMIPKELAEGESVESIRGIQWNTIFKTAQSFLNHKKDDIAEMKKVIEDLEKEIADLVKQREANQVPALTDSAIKGMISDAVSANFENVHTAQDKLCWLGNMEPNEKTSLAFGKALFPKLEDARTDIGTVQQACLSLLIKGDHYVNMCDELCNMIGQTAAKESAKTNRVKALTSLSDRIGKLEGVVKEKRGVLAELEAERSECEADEAALRAHKKELLGLSDVIKQEKVKLFMAWNAMNAAEAELTSLTADNEKLRENTEELDRLLADAGDEAQKIKDDLAKLEKDEKKLNDDLGIQTRQAKDIDAIVKSTGEAIEVVGEFKITLERMVLAQNEYYTKSIVDPIRKAESGFQEMKELKAQSAKTSKALADFCGLERTKTVLKGVSALPELPLICDRQIDSWKDISSNVDKVVTKEQGKQIQDLKDLEEELSRVTKENAYSGPPREGINSEVKGVWSSGTFYKDTLFVGSYLRGWKTLAPGADPKKLDGRWVRLCEQLDKYFNDAVEKQKKAQDLLAKTKGDFKELLAEMDQIKADLADAEKNKGLAKDKADAAKDKLAKMLGEEEVMQKNLVDLADKHERSLDALKKAEKTYVSTHEESLKSD